MRTILIIMLLPVLALAQEFQFQQELDSVAVSIGGYEPIAPWTSGNACSTPTFCDIDADSDLDLFVGNGGGTVWFLANNGSAMSCQFDLISFEYEGISLGPAGGQFNGDADPELCDLDADGDQDLFVSSGEGLIHYWENQGTQFTPDFIFVTDTLDGIDYPGTGGICFCDIDADGDFDLFTGATVFGYIRFYRNDGTPQQWDFTLVSTQFLGITTNGYSQPEFIDIDADGDFDFFVGEYNGRIRFYRNDGDSVNYNYTHVTNYFGNIDVGANSSPEFVDLDADGDYDLLVGREPVAGTVSPGDLFFYENIGSATQAQWNLVTKNFISLDVGNQAISVVTDIDNDLDQDLFFGNSGDMLSHYLNTGSDSTPNFIEITHQYQNITVNNLYPFFCDIDADQDPDLFCGEGQIPCPPLPGLHLFLNRGTPQNANYSLFSNNLVQGNFWIIIAPALADIDADGDYDLFISDQGDGDYFFYENMGTSQQFNFVFRETNWQGINTHVQSASCFYDIDQDNDLDLFFVPWEDWSEVWFYRNQGNAQLATMVLETETFLTFNEPHTFMGISITDIDNDGDGDFFLGDGAGGCLFFRNVTSQSPVDPRKRPVPTYPTIDLTLQPNPGNPVAIVLSLPSPQQATLAVYNLLGAKVATLTSGWQPAGQQRYFWETTPAASGVYLVRLEAGGETITKKLTVIK